MSHCLLHWGNWFLDGWSSLYLGLGWCCDYLLSFLNDSNRLDSLLRDNFRHWSLRSLRNDNLLRLGLQLSVITLLVVIKARLQLASERLEVGDASVDLVELLYGFLLLSFLGILDLIEFVFLGLVHGVKSLSEGLKEGVH